MPALLKVLVVDDEPLLVRSLKRLLQLEGFEVLTASDGLTALEVLAQHGVDVVLSDVRMPRLDGPGLLRALAEKGRKELPVVMLTGYADTTDDDLMRQGACAVLGKPVQPDLLCATLRQAGARR